MLMLYSADKICCQSQLRFKKLLTLYTRMTTIVVMNIGTINYE